MAPEEPKFEVRIYQKRVWLNALVTNQAELEEFVVLLEAIKTILPPKPTLLEKLHASLEAASTMTPEQARQRLTDEGFLDANGELSSRYGGPGGLPVDEKAETE